jgi:DNA mismatch repair ATPase MutS
LFSLLSHTCTPQGNALLRQWLLSPLQSVQQINERHDAIAFFMESGLQDGVGNIRGALKKSGNIQVGLKGIRRGGRLRPFQRTDGRAKKYEQSKRFWSRGMEIIVAGIIHDQCHSY